MTTDHDHTVFEALDVDECLRLAAGEPIGRLAVAQSDRPPHVVPVNFLLDGDVVMFRSGVGTKLRLARGAEVTFEVDAFDRERRTGWSVVFQGPAYEASHWESDGKSLTPWSPGDKEHWVRIVPTSISGRRISADPVVVHLRGDDLVRRLPVDITAGLAPWPGARPASSTRRQPT